MEAEAVVGGPPGEVFAFLADATNNPRWQRGMVACRWTSPAPIAVGSTYEQHARMLGRDLRMVFEVVDLEPDRSITIRTTDGPFPLEVTRRVAAAGAGTLASATIRGDASGVFGLATPVLRRVVERSVAADWERLPDAFTAHRQ